MTRWMTNIECFQSACSGFKEQAGSIDEDLILVATGVTWASLYGPSSILALNKYWHI